MIGIYGHKNLLIAQRKTGQSCAVFKSTD